MTTSSNAIDIAIVGGGAAGCVVASRLAASTNASILLLEAGPADHFPDDFHDGWRLAKGFDWGFTSEIDARGISEPVRRIRMLGGTSWLTRFAVRGSPADFDGWAALGNPGWGFDDILPVFRRIESDLEFGDAAWHGRDGAVPITRYPEYERSPIHAAAVEAMEAAGIPPVADHNRPGAVGVGRMPMSSRDGTRVTTRDAYLQLGSRPTNLTIRGDAQVGRILFEGTRATGVELLDGTTIPADRVVVCAGAYGSPAILLRSGIGQSADLRALGIPVVADLPGVGANLADHPAADVDTGWQGEGLDASAPVLHSIATFRSSSAAATDAPDLMFWVVDPREAAPGFTIDTVLLQPRSRGAVRLRSVDPTEAPIIELPGVRESIDVERLAEGLAFGREIANRPEIRALCDGPPPSMPAGTAELRRFVREEHYSVPHVVGTCAMGPLAADGAVVDARGAVHGVRGLSVVDASVIPEPPSGFPHLVTIMLAERLAEAIAREA